MKKLYIIRGWSGTGKSTLAHRLVGEEHIHDQDYYFLDENGVYTYDMKKDVAAQEWNWKRVEEDMKAGTPEICVVGIFDKKFMLIPYLRMSEKYEYSPQLITCSLPYYNIKNQDQYIYERCMRHFEDISLVPKFW